MSYSLLGNTVTLVIVFLQVQIIYETREVTANKLMEGNMLPETLNIVSPAFCEK